MLFYAVKGGKEGEVRGVDMARKIVVTSGKGGVGKTTIAVHLAAQLAQKGQRVILCDADFGLNNVDVATGVENLITYDLVDVIEGRCRAKQALIRHPNYPTLYVLTSSKATAERYVSPQAVKVVLDGLSPQFDFILIDCPAGIDDGFHRAVATADEAIVVTTPCLSALRDGDKVITALKSYRLSGLFLVVNMARGDLQLSGESLSPQEIEELLRVPLLGVLPDSGILRKGELSQIHTSFKMMANYLIYGRKKLYDPAKKYRGFLGNLRRVLKARL
ncbi:MAG: septum site-determining protein MinD [Clostridiales bacterium]|nr:septum site-determining protein MinD [Clostridiales bacterium]